MSIVSVSQDIWTTSIQQNRGGTSNQRELWQSCVTQLFPQNEQLDFLLKPL